MQAILTTIKSVQKKLETFQGERLKLHEQYWEPEDEQDKEYLYKY